MRSKLLVKSSLKVTKSIRKFIAKIEIKTIFDSSCIISKISIFSMAPYTKIPINKKTLTLSVTIANFSLLSANFEYKNILTPAKIAIIGIIKNTSR